MENKKAEEMRLRYLYRNLILRKRLRLPLKAALKIIGPDCAYHLYSITYCHHEDKTADG
jgi:hypothetical protein